MGYLQDFLFEPDRAHTRVEFLSGGERNRLLLAKLFSKPANVLVMDEPTNDLDAETLDLLEETLAEYAGTLLLVSHDRAFLNNVVTSTIVFEGDGNVAEYDGGYDDWLRQTKGRPGIFGNATSSGTSASASSSSAASAPEPAPTAKTRKLSYKEQRELEDLPGRIDDLEKRQAEYAAVMADPAFYKQDGRVVAEVQAEADTVARELQSCFERWELLDA